MTPQVRIGGPGGVWLSTLVPVGGIELDARWPLGAYQLDFKMLLRPGQKPSCVVEDALCDLMVGGRVVFPGRISEVNWDEGTVTVAGLCRDAETVAAFTSGGVTTTIPDTMIDTAISAGDWPVTRPASLSSVAMAAADVTADVNYIAAMLDLWADDNGKRWYVDASSAVRAGVDPTVPEIYVLPGAGQLSWATERQAGKIIGRYQTTSGGVLATVTVGSGRRQRVVDLTTRGPITSGQATSILNSILTQASSGGWSNSLTVAAEQLVTPGGLRPSLERVWSMAARGLMIRLLGHRDPRPGPLKLTTDVVLGRAVWNVDDREITLTPIGAVERDFSAIVEAAGGTVAA